MSQPSWNTNKGSLGTFSSGIAIIPIQLDATPILPAVNVSYKIITGSLPAGLSMSTDGLITGIPNVVYENNSTTFVVRAIDNRQNISDRTFSITVSGFDDVTFTTPSGTILETLDSVWIELPIEYNIPISDPTSIVRVSQGRLPPGLEINEFGLIRGYPVAPTIDVDSPLINTTATNITDNVITCYSTDGFVVGRPVQFSDVPFGLLVEGVTYYIHSIINDTSFTVSRSSNGPLYQLNDSSGFMTVTLPVTIIGEPIIKTYNFGLTLESIYGTDTRSYSIVVINQNTPFTKGGPGYTINSRVPTLLNTRPTTYNITPDQLDYSFYLLPPDSTGYTYNPLDNAFIGEITSDDHFYFQMLGKDFDGNNLEYIFAQLPLGLVGDSDTGWIRGTPIITDDTIADYSFGVSVRKKDKPFIASPYFNFSFRIKNGINGNITWLSNSYLGSMFNGTLSNLYVEATCDIPLKYELVSGSLPPNLTLLDNGLITGVVAFQPNSTITPKGTTSSFTFTIAAYSEEFSTVVRSEQTFTIDVLQQFTQPFETLYMKCTPSVSDRKLLASLLNNETLIPYDYLYRPTDMYYGKAKNATYEHMYGVYASSLPEYIASITKNHYWRNITLGELNTAVARDDNGNVMYEVVYSTVIDNLINPEGNSIAKEIYWPTLIPLSLGPWYTSVTNIYDSQTNQFTSSTPGSARILYPNSLPNMRQQIKEVVGQDPNARILPRWMTSQQLDGNIIGFIQAWVICYTKPGYSQTIKNNIETLWLNETTGKVNTLNTINFTIDRFTVDKSTTFNYDNNLSPPAWNTLPGANPVPNPLDSKDFNVLFPRKTILPDETQY